MFILKIKWLILCYVNLPLKKMLYKHLIRSFFPPTNQIQAFGNPKPRVSLQTHTGEWGRGGINIVGKNKICALESDIPKFGPLLCHLLAV